MFTLDPYAAQSCPRKTLLSHRPNAESTKLPDLHRLPAADQFINLVHNQVKAGRIPVRDLRGQATASHEDQENACLEAMDAQTPVILGGLLPRDWDGHRRGRAELLIRAEDGGYLPAIVKYQRALDARRDDLEFKFSPLSQVSEPRSITGWRFRWNWRWANALQLAHLWRLLEATGYHSAQPLGVIIGTDELPGHGLVGSWLDLDEVTVHAPPQPSEATESVQVSALERYDYEFASRVELAEAVREEREPRIETPQPVVTRECGYCEWWSDCRALLADDDLSLRINKSPLDRHEVTGLRHAGITTVTDLAAADLDALLPGYLPQVAHRQGSEERLRLAQRRSRMLVAGVELERQTSGPIAVPHAEVEIDIDVETSREDRVYLWGFWINDGEASHYRHFSSFTDLDPDAELVLAREAMTWLRGFVGERQALVFHYSAYEVLRLSRLTTDADEVLSWALGFAETNFVDLFEVVREHFFGANGLGLKAVASAGPGFHWRDQDPGGLNSMTWFHNAVHAATETERTLARERVLCYNEDDVRATAALRHWLRAPNE